MKKNKIFTLGLLLFLGLQLLFTIPLSPSQLVSADIDTLTLEDDFEEKYYNNIYSQYENATIIEFFTTELDDSCDFEEGDKEGFAYQANSYMTDYSDNVIDGKYVIETKKLTGSTTAYLLYINVVTFNTLHWDKLEIRMKINNTFGNPYIYILESHGLVIWYPKYTFSTTDWITYSIEDLYSNTHYQNHLNFRIKFGVITPLVSDIPSYKLEIDFIGIWRNNKTDYATTEISDSWDWDEGDNEGFVLTSAVGGTEVIANGYWEWVKVDTYYYTYIQNSPVIDTSTYYQYLIKFWCDSSDYNVSVRYRRIDMGYENILLGSTVADTWVEYTVNLHDFSDWGNYGANFGVVFNEKNELKLEDKFRLDYLLITYNNTIDFITPSTTHKKQETSYYRAFGGLYSYFHNVTKNSTYVGKTIKHNSSIIINFVALSIFPQALVFFLYFNCFYNISLFIGTQEYVLLTHDYSTDDWRYIDIKLERKNYLITDLNVDFYIKIYPIENNNVHDIFYMDNLKVKYTDPEPTIDYSTRCVVGEQYNNFVSINATSNSFYAQGTGVNPSGWLDYYTTQAWQYKTSSNAIMSRGMTLGSLWTLKQYEPVNNFFVETGINMTIDKEYYLYDSFHFIATGGAGKVSMSRELFLYIDNNLVYYVYDQSIIDRGYLDNYFELSYIINFNQLNEHTMQYSSTFSNAYTNQSDWRPLIFPINEEIQTGLNVMQYEQMTHYTVDVESASNPIIYQKVYRDIHNSPISDFTIPDIEGGFFRTIWERLLEYIGEATGIQGLLWQQLNLERAYQELLADMMADLIEGTNNPDWLNDYYEDIQDIQDTYAGGIVSTWRNLFSNDDYSGLEIRFDTRWGGMFRGATQGESSFFTRMFGRIFGESVSIIPQLIWTFFSNFKNWIVIGFVMFIIMFMKALMKRDYDRVMGIARGSLSVILFIVQVIKWFIGFIIRILTMIGGFIPFT